MPSKEIELLILKSNHNSRTPDLLTAVRLALEGEGPCPGPAQNLGGLQDAVQEGRGQKGPTGCVQRWQLQNSVSSEPKHLVDSFTVPRGTTTRSGLGPPLHLLTLWDPGEGDHRSPGSQISGTLARPSVLGPSGPVAWAWKWTLTWHFRAPFQVWPG